MGIAVAHEFSQLLHDQRGAFLDLLLIGIAGLFDVALGNAMGTEKNMGGFRHIAVMDFGGDQLSHRLQIAGVVVPAANATNRKLFKRVISLP